MGCLNPEALREEVHRFNRFDHTPTMGSSHALCCTTAMQEIKSGGLRLNEDQNRSPDMGDRRKNARVISGRRAVLETICRAVSVRSMRGQRCASLSAICSS